MKYTTNSKTAGIGCACSLITVGGLIGGIYHGFADSKGVNLDANVEHILNYGPMLISGLLGFVGGSSIVENKENLEEIIQNAPIEIREEVREHSKGCFPLTSAVVYPIMVGSVTYGGYMFGSWLGKQF
jgi:hypothetical protein